MKRVHLAIGVGGLLLGLVTASTSAVVHDVRIPDALYGRLNQRDTHVYPSASCGPSSMANALAYLDSSGTYTSHCGTSLLPSPGYSGLISLADTLAGPAYMKTDSSGTWSDNLIAGTVNYIESKVPGWTRYSAQDCSD